MNIRPCPLCNSVCCCFEVAPTPEEMGHCDSVYLTEVGDTQVVVFKHGKWLGFSLILATYVEDNSKGNSRFPSADKEDGAISTVVIRGSTDNLMDDIERAVDDGVNTFKLLVRVGQQKQRWSWIGELLFPEGAGRLMDVGRAHFLGQATATWSRRHRDRTGQAAHPLRRGRQLCLHSSGINPRWL